MSDHENDQFLVQNHLEEAAEIIRASILLTDTIIAAADLISNSILDGGKVMWCGNGGSAADSQHLAAELVGRYKLERHAIPSIALTTDTSVITAIGNDFGFEHIFKRQIEALGNPGDVLVAITTSGKSNSVIAAIDAAKSMKIGVILFSSTQSPELGADINILIASNKTEQIQHGHIAIGHVMCELIEMKTLPK